MDWLCKSLCFLLLSFKINADFNLSLGPLIKIQQNDSPKQKYDSFNRIQKEISYLIHECPTYVLFLSKSLVQHFPYKNGNYEELELIKIR